MIVDDDSTIGEILTQAFENEGYKTYYSGTAKEARPAGFDNYFIKPFHINELVKVANTSLRDLEKWYKILQEARKSEKK